MRQGQYIFIGEQWGRLWFFVGPDRAVVLLDDGRKELLMEVALESLDPVPLVVREQGMDAYKKERRGNRWKTERW